METQYVALLGTALSALIAALAYYGKARREQLRTTRTVLYYLLEMRHHFAIAEHGLSRFSDQYLEMVAAAYTANGVTLQDSERNALAPILNHLLREISSEKVAELGKQISDPYLRALTDLSRDNPVLAYNLKGREILTRASTAIAECFQLTNIAALSPEDVQVKDALFSEIDDFDRQLTLDLLESASRKVAAHCGPIMYLQTRLVLRQQNRPKTFSELGPKFDAVLNKFLNLAAERESQKPHQIDVSTKA